MEKKNLSEEALAQKIKSLYDGKYEGFSKSGEPIRVLFTEIAEALNSEQIAHPREEEWTWQRVHTFVSKNPEVGKITT